MLYLNVNEQIMKEWAGTIDLYYALQLARFQDSLKSVTLHITEEQEPNNHQTIYFYDLNVVPVSGPSIHIQFGSADCSSGIQNAFAKAKRILLRRARGFSLTLPLKQLG